MLPLAVLMSAGIPAAAQDTGLSDDVLPKDTFLHVSIRDVTKMKEQFWKSSLGQAIQDPAMDDFREELQRAFDALLAEGFAEVEDALGVSVPELLEISSGELSLSISRAGNRLGLIAHVDFGESQAQVDTLLEKAEEALSQASRLSMSTEDINGTEVTLYTVEGDVPTPLIQEFGWFIRDSHFVACSSRNVMEALLNAWDGTAEETLRNNETYSTILGRLRTEAGSADAVFYLDPIGLFKALVSTGSLGEAQMIAGMAAAQLPLLGFDQIRGIGAVWEFVAEGEVESIQRAMLYAEQPPRSLMQLFMLDTVSATPPDWVTDDVSMYASIKWKIREAYEAVEALVDGFQGAGTLGRLIDQAAQSGPRIHIRKDIIDQLNGQIHIVSGGYAGRTAASFGSSDLLFAFGLNNPDAFQDTLRRVADTPGIPLEVREFRGFTLYEIAGPIQTFSFSVAHGHFLMAFGNSIMEQVLRGDDDLRPLAESDDYHRVTARFPSEVVSVSFVRTAEQYRALYEMLRSGEAAGQFPGMDEIFEQIDFTTLPPFEAVSRHFGPSGGYSVSDENGLVSEGFSLRP